MSEFFLIAHYAYRENYGAHDWDGQGICPQYWKNKFGHVAYIETLSLDEVMALGQSGLRDRVGESRLGFGRKDDFTEYHLLDYELVEYNLELIERIASLLDEPYAINPLDGKIDRHWLGFETNLPEAVIERVLQDLEHSEEATDSVEP